MHVFNAALAAVYTEIAVAVRCTPANGKCDSSCLLVYLCFKCRVHVLIMLY
jgi:hypothetical protein